MSVTAIDRHISADKKKQILPQKHPYMMTDDWNLLLALICVIYCIRGNLEQNASMYTAVALLSNLIIRVNGYKSFILLI